MEAALGNALIVKFLAPRYSGKGLEISPNQLNISGSYPNLTKGGSMWFSLTSTSAPCVKIFREFRNQSSSIGALDSPALSFCGQLDSLLAFDQEYAEHSFY